MYDAERENLPLEENVDYDYIIILPSDPPLTQ